MQIDGIKYINTNTDRWSNKAAPSQNRQALAQAESISQNNNTYVSDISTAQKTKETDNTDKNKQKIKTEEENKNKSTKELDVDNTVLSFKKHKDTGEIMVRIINKDTGEVIREIPPEKILDCIAQLWKISGFNVDKKV